MNNTLLKVLILLIVLSFVLESGIVRAQSITNTTFCRIGLNTIINDNSTIIDSVQIAGIFGASVIDVNVRIDSLDHTAAGDLNLYLRKENRSAKIFNRTGGLGDNFLKTILNDSALISIDSSTPPFTGSFRPHSPLSLFNYLNLNGTWYFTITDTVNGNTGKLRAWCLTFTYTYFEGGINTIEIPNTYRLYQNYPNPFNPLTKIKYGLPKNGNVKLTVFDELGKKVKVLFDEYQQANKYEAVFDATNLPSGVYYYKLEADGFSDSKKMIIIK